MSPTLYDRLTQFRKSISSYEPTDAVPWSLAVVFNTLLEDSKTEYPDDQVIAKLPAAQQAPGRLARENVGFLWTVVDQVLMVVSSDSPPS